MSRVKKPNQKYMNVLNYNRLECLPSKVERIYMENEDYHKAKTLSQGLFIKYDMKYSIYRNKSKSRRDSLKKEYEEDTKK